MVGKWQPIMTTNPFLRIEEACWRKTLLDFNECFEESWDMTSNKKYAKGKELLIADSLSRSQTTNQNRSEIEEEIETRRLVHEDQSLKSHLTEIAEATAKNAVLQSVILHHIWMGWKSSKPNVPFVGICVTPTIYEVSRYLCDPNYEVSRYLCEPDYEESGYICEPDHEFRAYLC